MLFILSPKSNYAVVGSHITVMDGRTTLWGWLEYARFVALVFTLGLLGGTTFWLAAIGKRGTPRTTDA